MYIETGSVWRKAPTNGSAVWSGEKFVVAATAQNVIIRNEFVSKLTPILNKEEVVARADFEREYVTKAEASRRIEAASRAILDALKPKPVLGTPVLFKSDGYGVNTYEASNGVRIRFTSDGHYYIDNTNTSNPVSSFDAAWIANKSAELQRAYRNRSRYGW